MNNDHNLEHEVLEQLKSDPHVHADDIFVSVLNGTVTLDGTVPTYAYGVAASESVQHMNGVLEVINNLVVKLSETYSRPDSEIKDAAINAIGLTTTVPMESVTVTVHNGWLRLEGTVEHWQQKDAAEIAVRHLAGLAGITNLISVKPLDSQPDVCNAIEIAFERHALLDARKINVATSGATVFLSGNASSMAAKTEAERAAWSAKGVENVENQIAVVP
jgi:osmotically-inducible protein OsmY